MKNIFTIIFSIIFISFPAPIFSQSTKVYEYWLDEFLLPKLQQKYHSHKIIDEIDMHLKNNIDSVITLKRLIKKNEQAEFSEPSKYFNKKLILQKTEEGKKNVKSLHKTLEEIENIYKVDKHFLLAIWANETFFGKVRPRLNAVQVLSLLSFSSKNRLFYLKELLYLIDFAIENKINIKEIKASKAGALGQPQFLPSTLVKFAVDFDNDGNIDIWSSQSDILASIANYLKQFGWDNSLEWGYEVKLTKSISCYLEGPDHSRSLSQWKKLGVSRFKGKKFPQNDLNNSYSLMFPAGIYGPIYLVSKNFYTLKEYNNSDLYALSVGFIADKIKYKSHDFFRPWEKTETLTKNEIIGVQEMLSKRYDTGGIDGLIGYKTRRAIGLYQRDNNLQQTCWPPL